MSFPRLERFVTTAELGSISRAAEKLNIVQPALSQSIKQLEEELGTQLLLRSGKGIELTAEGRVFLEHAYGILSQYRKARENITDMHGKPSGGVSIAMVSSAIDVLTVPVCRALKDQYPLIELDLEEGLVSNIQHGLDAGRYDIVISYAIETARNIAREPLIEEELFLTTKYSGKTTGRYVELHELGDVSLIIPRERDGSGVEVGQTAQNLDLELVTSQFSGAIHPTLKLIEAGMGASLLPWSAVRDGLSDGRLHVEAVRKPGLHQTVHMMHAEHKPVTRATAAVMEVIRQSVRATHKSGEWPGNLLV